MREILFRGKVPEDCPYENLRGQWVEGSLVHQTEYYGSPVDRYHILYTGEFDCDFYDSVVVIPETIGQFTGLLDKNGKKIFEGDIVKGSILYDVGCYPHEEILTQPVIFTEAKFWPVNRLMEATIEVIGNIHDNPELLEVK